MVTDQKILYKDKEYQIISVEQEYIIHPTALDIQPLKKIDDLYDFTAYYYLDGYNLYIEKLKLKNSDNTSKEFAFTNCKPSYNGSILIGADIVKEYHFENIYPACFSYQNVIELIFEDGLLVTAIDHNRDMHRIRKNLDLGLRNLNNKKDIRCIKRFLDSAFVGDYSPFKLSFKRQRYIKKMKNFYDKEKLTFTQI